MSAAFFKSKKFIISAVVVVLVAVLVVMIVLLNQHDGMKVDHLGEGHDITQRRAEDYGNSRLWLYDTGTFTVRIVYRDTIEFLGIGTFVKDGDAYTFTYYNIFQLIDTPQGPKMRRDAEHAEDVVVYVVEGGMIKFFDVPSHKYFFFR